MLNNQEIIDKIIALKARTANNNCSEAEVEAAMKLAVKLMAKHDISEKDLKAKGQSAIVRKKLWPGKGRLDPIVSACATAVSYLTEVRIYTQGGSIIIFGTELDVEIAAYIIELIYNSARQSWQMHRYSEYGKLSKAVSTKLRNSYLLGYTDRVKVKIYAEYNKRQEDLAKQSTGTSLVSIKHAMAQESAEEFFDTIHPAAPQREVEVEYSSYNAGMADGNDFEFKDAIDA